VASRQTRRGNALLARMRLRSVAFTSVSCTDWLLLSNQRAVYPMTAYVGLISRLFLGSGARCHGVRARLGRLC